MTISFEDWVAEQMKDPLFRRLAETLEPDYDAAWQRIMRRLTQEARRLMGLKPLASLAVEIAEGLRDEATVIDLGQNYGLSSLDLALEGPSGDLAQGPLYDKACDFNPNYAAAKEGVSLEQAADEIKECVLPLRNWRSLARKHDLKTIFLSVRRSAGAEKRYLHTKKGGAELPGDPLIMF